MTYGMKKKNIKERIEIARRWCGQWQWQVHQKQIPFLQSKHFFSPTDTATNFSIVFFTVVSFSPPNKSVFYEKKTNTVSVTYISLLFLSRIIIFISWISQRQQILRFLWVQQWLLQPLLLLLSISFPPTNPKV